MEIERKLVCSAEVIGTLSDYLNTSAEPVTQVQNDQYFLRDGCLNPNGKIGEYFRIRTQVQDSGETEVVACYKNKSAEETTQEREAIINPNGSNTACFNLIQSLGSSEKKHQELGVHEALQEVGFNFTMSYKKERKAYLFVLENEGAVEISIDTFIEGIMNGCSLAISPSALLEKNFPARMVEVELKSVPSTIQQISDANKYLDEVILRIFHDLGIKEIPTHQKLGFNDFMVSQLSEEIKLKLSQKK